MLSPDHDACGIGFVADASGKPSRSIVTSALNGLACVKHRGAFSSDSLTGDGSGLLLPIPPSIFGTHPNGTVRGVASLFVRSEPQRSAIESSAEAEGLRIVQWRIPPTDETQIGDIARRSQPEFLQLIFEAIDGDPDEASAYRFRRRIQASTTDIYVASCSFRTIVYKGLVSADSLAGFYPDLANEAFAASFAIFHQRFSTNTTPTWERAQPFRTLCHNGEINAIAGNRNRMRARGLLGTEAAGLGPEELFAPVLDDNDSDSGQLDSAVELLLRGGRNVRHSVGMLVVEAWEGAREIDPDVRGFYRYHSSLVEPWDGPAGLVFTDGLGVGAALDRNGLRPLRYAICSDGFVTACSEAGAVDTKGHGTVTRGRLGPGQMLFVDPLEGILDDTQCKERMASQAPYARWAADGLRPMSRGAAIEQPPSAEELLQRQIAHGYTTEELRMVIKPMVEQAKEPVFSMGDDVPLPNFVDHPRPIHHYLKQRFAQVTNPPIDHLRERLVMSLRTLLGPRQPLLSEVAEAARLITLKTFFLYPAGVELLERDDINPFGQVRLDATFHLAAGADGLRSRVQELCGLAVDAVRAGSGILVIDNSAIGSESVAVPSLLATGAIHHALMNEGLRDSASLVISSDDARDVHYVACLLGYGADAICPRLALETVAVDADTADDSDITSAEAQDRYQAAVEDGVLKIMSKMGISTLDSYRGAQVFEAIALSSEVVEVCFAGTPTAVQGIGWSELGADAISNHEASGLSNPGYYRDLKRGGEYHTHNKDVVQALQDMSMAHLLQKALRSDSDDLYLQFAALVNGRPPTELRDLLELLPLGSPVPLEEVEPVTDIVRRFSTGAMSHGSLSAEAHETLAEAMNLIGGKSNCGEGGEDPFRFRTRGHGHGDKNSKIKQIASGRFGVTPLHRAGPQLRK